MLEFVLASFTALFVTVNPIKAAAIYPALTEHLGPAERRGVAARGTLVATLLLLAAILLVMLIVLGSLLAAGYIEGWLGPMGTNVIARVLGILLTAVSAEMILTGLKQSGVFLRP